MKSKDGQEFLKSWNRIYLVGGIATAGPLLVGSTFKLGVGLLSKATIASTQNFLRASLLKMVMELNIPNFTQNTLKVIDSGYEVYKETNSILKINEVTRLQQEGVLFVKGEMTAGRTTKTGFAVVYKGEVIASGEARVVRSSLGDVWKLKGTNLTNALDELYEIISFVKQITPRLKTAVNEAFFWSGRADGIGGEMIALEIATSKKGITLEALIEKNNIAMPDWDITNPKSIKIWQKTSESYAKQSSGEIRAIIGKNVRGNSVWNEYELPALKSNPNVSKIIVIDPKTRIEKIISKN